MTSEELRDYVEEQRTLNNIPYHIYSALIDGIDTLEPCEDTISRQAVLDMLEDINAETEGVGFYYEHYVEYIKKLPPVKPQEPRWIPVTERLPESCGMYIVTRKIYDCPDTAPIIMSDESWFDGQNTWHNDNRINHKRGYLSDVIAWMPLPEPYKAKRSSEE